jgi:hypothetical protein
VYQTNKEIRVTDPKAPGAVRKAGNLLPRAGFVASAITTVCCLGISAAVSLASSVGATFLTQDGTLQPLLAVVLAITVAGSAWSARRHRSLMPLILSVIASALVYSALYGPLHHGIGVANAAGNHAGHHTMHDSTAGSTSSHVGHDAMHESTAGSTSRQVGHDAMHDSTAGSTSGQVGHTAAAKSSHGGISSTVLVWIGLVALFVAQLWDARRVRRCRRSGTRLADGIYSLVGEMPIADQQR